VVRIHKIIKQVGTLIFRNKMNDQNQKSGDNSKNLQAGRDIIVHGLSYTETKDLVKTEAQEVFKSNSLVLANEAYKLVLSRSEELIDSFLRKLEDRKPEAIESMRDPGMQYSLYNAQKEYAKTGDKDLADLLEDILVERAQNPQRDLMHIVLDECINVAPKLTPDQFDALTLIFVLRYTMNYGVKNQVALIQYLLQNILLFQSGIREEQSRYQHLEFLSCGTQSLSKISIAGVFRENYKILFSKGFTIEEFEQTVGIDAKYKKYLIPHTPAENKYQINIINSEQVKVVCKTDNLTDNEIERINAIYNSSTMNEQECKAHLIKLYPPFESFMEKWDKSIISNMTLTSVGIAIGHANMKRKNKQARYDLSIWIK
jgi:hypothetical protein